MMSENLSLFTNCLFFLSQLYPWFIKGALESLFLSIPHLKCVTTGRPTIIDGTCLQVV